MADQEIALRNASSVRQDLGGTELSLQNEVASTAIAAQMQALVQARYAMAVRYRRDWDTVRDRLLKECRRPGFAEAAIYRKPIGKGIEGLSIRFAEAAIRCMTNVAPEVFAIYDDAEKRIVRVCVTDIEANVPYSKDIVIDKTVERSSLKEGVTPLRVRQNSAGKLTYLVPATEDDLLNKENALVSKALRTLALRILPGDIREECEAACRKVREDKFAKDPDGEKRKLLDSFSLQGVNPAMLAEFLGHPLDAILPAELAELRGVFQGIREGEATWADVMTLRLEGRSAPGEGAAAGAATTAGAKKLKDRITTQKVKTAPAAVSQSSAPVVADRAPATAPGPTVVAPKSDPSPASAPATGMTKEEMDADLALQLAREAEAEAASQSTNDGWGDE